jgi:hypothetical protein
MHWLVYHVASGHAFFTRVVLVVAAAIASTRTGRIHRSITGLALLSIECDESITSQLTLLLTPA